MVGRVAPRTGLFGIRNPFRNNFGRNNQRATSQQGRFASAFEHVAHRCRGMGVIPAGMLMITLVLFFKDLFSDLYVHTLGKAYAGDKSHLKTEADLQILDRKYLLRSGLVDLPVWMMSLASFLKFEMPISTVVITGLWLFRNFVDNLILNRKNKTLLALNDMPLSNQSMPPQQNYPPQQQPRQNPQGQNPLGGNQDDGLGDGGLSNLPGDGSGNGSGQYGASNGSSGIPPNGYGNGGLMPGYAGQGGLTGGGQYQPPVVINFSPNMPTITRNG